MKDPKTAGKHEETEPVVGDRVDRRFLLKREIARGGMGAVFVAEQQITGRTVAIKLALGEGLRLEQAQERLLREARAITAARHPGIIELLDAGVCDQHGPYLVLEVVHGLTLDRILGVRQTLPVEAVVHIGRQLCEALVFAHARGVVHRDLKPGNIFLARADGTGEVVKLFDFGIAELSAAVPALRKLTRETDLLGTPEYMAPEQLGGEPADHRCDIYAVGVTMFECLTGEVPLTGGYRQIVVKVMRSGGPPSVRALRKDVSPALDEVIARALAIEAGDRFADAAAFRDALVGATGLADGRTSLLGDGSDLGADDAEAHVPSLSTERARVERGPITEPIPLVRRKHVRAVYASKVRIELPDAVVVRGRTLDMSEGGLLVSTDPQLVDRQQVFVRLALPSGDGLATVQATVRRHSDMPPGQSGLQFRHLPPEVRQDIAAYVERMSARDSSGGD